MAQDTFVRDWVIAGEKDETAIVRYLKEIQVRYGTITSFFVSEKTRKYYHSSGILKTVNQIDKQDQWYFRVQKMQQDYEVNVDTDTAHRTSLTIFINHRVYDYAGKYIGAIGVGLSVEAVKKLIEDYKDRFGRKIYFINKTGKVTLRGTSYTGPESIREIQGLAPSVTKILASPSSSINYIDNGNKFYLNSRYVPEFEWYLIVEQQQDEAEILIENTFFINLGVSLLFSAIIVFIATLSMRKYQRKLETMATTDKLTGAANRQVFDVLFQQAHNQSKRSKIPLSSIMYDIDYFKQVNDTYGHPTGDVVLKTITQTVKNHIREADILFRWGGEEFFIILPECELDKGLEIAENICRMVENHTIRFAGKSLSITISAGVTTMHKDDTAETLIERSDKALYLAKEKGRNRVEAITP